MGLMALLKCSKVPSIHTQYKQTQKFSVTMLLPGGGATLGISGWGCATGTLEPLTYTRASSAKFCSPLLEETP